MQFTLVGLPNTCSVCGKPLTREDGWYAEHDDAARSGAGVCADHVVETTHANPNEPATENGIETNPPALDDTSESNENFDGDDDEAADADDAEDESDASDDDEMIELDALRNADGEFVSPEDQDADGKPEIIKHKKRKAKRAKKKDAK